ncbi:MAG: hypothetical protein IPH45_19115 [Bacteroidales bacterium]|nr:hypothetical protein [Bacteroidales bacterium]
MSQLLHQPTLFASEASVTFTATPVNGGTYPIYQWYVNGLTVGTNLNTYSYVPTNGDQVYVIMTSSEACVSGNPATSNTVSMMVNPLQLPIAVLPSNGSTLQIPGPR